MPRARLPDRHCAQFDAEFRAARRSRNSIIAELPAGIDVPWQDRPDAPDGNAFCKGRCSSTGMFQSLPTEGCITGLRNSHARRGMDHASASSRSEMRESAAFKATRCVSMNAGKIVRLVRPQPRRHAAWLLSPRAVARSPKHRVPDAAAEHLPTPEVAAERTHLGRETRRQDVLRPELTPMPACRAQIASRSAIAGVASALATRLAFVWHVEPLPAPRFSMPVGQRSVPCSPPNRVLHQSAPATASHVERLILPAALRIGAGRRPACGQRLRMARRRSANSPRRCRPPPSTTISPAIPLVHRLWRSRTHSQGWPMASLKPVGLPPTDRAGGPRIAAIQTAW